MEEKLGLEYIAVEGLIGAGKTILAKKMSAVLNSHLILEEVDENPFLARFYEDRRLYAFQTQIFFLLSRYHQQLPLSQPTLFSSGIIVADYLFEKDRIFASVNLSEGEFLLYEKLYQILERNLTVKPTKIVYLQASLETTWERIKKRGRYFEKKIDLDYLAQLQDAYNKFFLYYSKSPLLIVNTENIDFVERKSDFNELLQAILNLKEGKRFFS